MVEITPPSTGPQLDQPSLKEAVGLFTPYQKKVLIILGGLFVLFLVVGGLVFYWWLTSFQTSQVDLKISGPTQVASGALSNFTISFWNNTNQVLGSAVLTIRWPQGTIVQNESGELRVIDQTSFIEKRELGNIGIGGGGKVDFIVSLIGGDKSVQNIRTELSYKPQNTTSSFQNSQDQTVAINGSALGIDFKAPNAVFPGSRVAYEISYNNNTDRVFHNAEIELTYPPDFILVTSDLTPTGNQNTWQLGDLNGGAPGKIKIEGVYRGNLPQIKFSSAVGILVNGNFVKFGDLTSSVDIGKAPLTLDITSDVSDSLVKPGDFINYKIHYKNNSNIVLSDPVLKVKLDGLLFDFGTINTTGFFSSLNNTITWNASNYLAFRSLGAGDEGDLTFQIRLKPQYIIRTFRDKNFVLNATATLETPTVPSLVTAPSLVASADLALKVKTRAELNAFGLNRDQTVLNSGPIPPKVNKATTYAIHWQLKNYSNDVANTVIKASLGQGVSWTNKVSGKTQGLEYDSRTNSLVWNVGDLPAATGILTDPVEAVFQVALTPAANQAGSNAILVSEAVFFGHDNFTDRDISFSASAITSDLTNEFGTTSQSGRVSP